MKITKLTTLLILLFPSSQTPQIKAQSIANEDIDLQGCYSDLNTADRDGDGLVRRNEYLSFIQEYGKRICFKTDALTLQQEGLFHSLACFCRSQEGADPNCCLGDNARIFTAGALNPDRTPSQEDYLTSVCKLTVATIDAKCPPVIQPRGDPVSLLPLTLMPKSTNAPTIEEENEPTSPSPSELTRPPVSASSSSTKAPTIEEQHEPTSPSPSELTRPPVSASSSSKSRRVISASFALASLFSTVTFVVSFSL